MAKPGLRVSCSLFECLFFYELFYKVFTALLFGFYILYNFYTAYILYFFYRFYIFSTAYVYWLSVVRFGHWVCGESWHAIKDSLTHRPSSQGWAPGVLPFNVQVFVSCVYLDGGMGGGG